MGRPRAGSELKRTVTLSLSPEVIAFLDATGNRSAAVETLVTAMGRYATADDAVMAQWFQQRQGAEVNPREDTTTITTGGLQISQQETPAKPDRKPIPNRKEVVPIFKR